MERLSEKLNIKRYKKESQPSVEWKETAKEMTAYFGKNCYWLPWKYEKWKIYEKFKQIKEQGKKDLGYFLGMLNK
jgi:hypothetical protein